MLVLSRRPSDQIVIPDLGITLKVIAIRGNTVRLGIDAPSNVVILRGELVDATSDGSPSNHPQTVSASPPIDDDLDQGTGCQCPPQPKKNSKLKKKAYGTTGGAYGTTGGANGTTGGANGIGGANGLRKYMPAVQVDGLRTTSETTVESTIDAGDVDVAVENDAHQVGEEPALYQISF